MSILGAKLSRRELFKALGAAGLASAIGAGSAETAPITHSPAPALDPLAPFLTPDPVRVVPTGKYSVSIICADDPSKFITGDLIEVSMEQMCAPIEIRSDLFPTPVRRMTFGPAREECRLKLYPHDIRAINHILSSQLCHGTVYMQGTVLRFDFSVLEASMHHLYAGPPEVELLVSVLDSPRFAEG